VIRITRAPGITRPRSGRGPRSPSPGVLGLVSAGTAQARRCPASTRRASPWLAAVAGAGHRSRGWRGGPRRPHPDGLPGAIDADREAAARPRAGDPDGVGAVLQGPVPEGIRRRPGRLGDLLEPAEILEGRVEDVADLLDACEPRRGRPGRRDDLAVEADSLVLGGRGRMKVATHRARPLLGSGITRSRRPTRPTADAGRRDPGDGTAAANAMRAGSLGSRRPRIPARSRRRRPGLVAVRKVARAARALATRAPR